MAQTGTVRLWDIPAAGRLGKVGGKNTWVGSGRKWMVAAAAVAAADIC